MNGSRLLSAHARAWSAALVATLLFALFAISARAASQRDVQNCVQDTDSDRRLAACTRIIESRGESRDNRSAAYNNRGLAWKTQGDLDRAISDFTEAIRLDPTDIQAYHNRGSALTEQGDYDRAIADYDQALRLNRRFADGYNGRGVAWHDKGEYDRAIADYTEAIRLDPQKALFYRNRGDSYSEKGDYDQAIADFSQVIRFNPRSASAYDSRGSAYHDKGDHDRAIADYTEAVRLDPDYPDAYVRRGNAYNDKGKPDLAIADYDKAIRLDPKYARAYYERGEAYRDKDEYDRAISDYTEAIRLDPKYAYAYNGRGRARKARGELDRAIADYGEAVRLKPDYGWAYTNRGLAWVAKGDLDRAIADFTTAIGTDRSGDTCAPCAYDNRGDAWRTKGDLDRAIADYSEAIRLDPKSRSFLKDRGYAYFFKGDFTSASADFQRVIDIDAAELRSAMMNLVGLFKFKEDAYTLLWHHLARARSGEFVRTELATNAQNLTRMQAWPAPIVQFYISGQSADDLVVPENANQRCEAQFYLGEWHLLKDQKFGAETAFRKAADGCPETSIEHEGAQIELKRLALSAPASSAASAPAASTALPSTAPAPVPVAAAPAQSAAAIVLTGEDVDARDGVALPRPRDVTYRWGGDTLLDQYNGDDPVQPGSPRRWAAWHVDNLKPGFYQVFVTYAAAESRPLRLLIDGDVYLSKIADETTGSWDPAARREFNFGQVRIRNPKVEFRLETMAPNQHWPHFKAMRLVPLEPTQAAAVPASPPSAAQAQTAPDELMGPGPLPEFVFGSPSAPVTVVAYISLTCKECASSFNDKFMTLKSRYIDSGQMRFIVRELAVTSLDAAGFMLARCAGESKTFSLIQTLLARRDEWLVRNPIEPLTAIAREAGLDKERVGACLQNQEMLTKLSLISARAVNDFAVKGVPTFFINGRKFEGQTDWGSPLLDDVAKLLKPYDELYCGLTEDVMPDAAAGFMDWCEQRGFSTRDFRGGTCNAAVGSAVTLVATMGTGGRCEALKRINDGIKANDDNEGPFTRPIYQWLKAHPESIKGHWADAIFSAIDGIYACRASMSDSVRR